MTDLSIPSSLPANASNSGGLKINNLNDLERLSKLLAASRFFQDAKDASQCAVKVLAGFELGLGAFQSMAGIHIINGKPSIGAGLMASKLKSSSKYDYEALVHSDTECIIAVFESEFKSDIRSLKKKLVSGEIGEDQYNHAISSLSIGVSSFTLDDAKRAGTQNMGKFPKNMLFARCISNAIKWYAPDLFCVSVYVPEEMGADVDDDGNVLSIPNQPQYPLIVETALPLPSHKKAIPQANSRVVSDADSKEKAKLIADIGSKLSQLGISKENAREMVMQRYNKEKGFMLSLNEMHDFSQYLHLVGAPLDADVDTDTETDADSIESDS
jgi:hypothetical protein